MDDFLRVKNDVHINNSCAACGSELRRTLSGPSALHCFLPLTCLIAIPLYAVIFLFSLLPGGRLFL